MKKIYKRIMAFIIAAATSSMMSATYYAEQVYFNSESSNQEYSVEQNAATPRAILPVGIYYCESDRYAYIQIHSTTSASTTCTIYNVYYSDEDKYICEQADMFTI